MHQNQPDISAPRELIFRANRLASAGEHQEAIALLKECLATHPSHAGALNELGVIHYQLGEIAGAKNYFEQTLSCQPDFPRALVNLGACCNELKDNTGAIRHYKEALALAPGMLDAWGNLAKAYTDSEEFELAVYCYRKALSLEQRPDFKRGLAKAYRKSGRHDRSETLLRQVIVANPHDADAHFGLSFTLFYQRRYREALDAFEWRMRTREMLQHQKDLYPIFEKPAYQGGDLAGKTVLIHTEQGFGDCIQFARFAPLLAARAEKLVLWTRPGLGRLLSLNLPFAEYSENVFRLPAFDIQLPLLSIPHWFDPELKLLDSFQPYLAAPPPSRQWTDDSDGRLKIGLVWGASDSGFDYANKKVSLEQLRPLLEAPNTSWYSLQVGSDRADLEDFSLGNQLTDLGKDFRDFCDTAQAIAEMDLVISCDTSVAHLAGAMGKPVWLMLKKEPDWRWGSDGDTTPWYPGARLFRQQSHGDWSLVMKRMARELARLAANPRAMPAMEVI